jgi:hypothetical protein
LRGKRFNVFARRPPLDLGSTLERRGYRKRRKIKPEIIATEADAAGIS